MASTLILHEVDHLRQHWGWLLALGICMVILGDGLQAVIPIEGLMSQ